MLPRLGRNGPRSASPFDRRRALPGMEFAASAAQLAQIALEQCVRIEADAVAVGDPVRRILAQQRTQFVNSGGVEPLELGELRELGLKRVELLAFVVARVDQHRHPPAEWDSAKARGRIVE